MRISIHCFHCECFRAVHSIRGDELLTVRVVGRGADRMIECRSLSFRHVDCLEGCVVHASDCSAAVICDIGKAFDCPSREGGAARRVSMAAFEAWASI